MFDETGDRKSDEWRERTAEEIAEYLHKAYPDDPERMALLVGRIMAPAIMMPNPNQMIWWGIVACHVHNQPLDDAILRELQLLTSKWRRPLQ